MNIVIPKLRANREAFNPIETMKTVTLYLVLSNTGEEFQWEGANFDFAAAAMIREIADLYGAVPEEIFEGLLDLKKGETTFRRWDFSTPEENFVLSTEPIPFEGEDHVNEDHATSRAESGYAQ